MIDQTRIQQIIKRLFTASSVEERLAINPPREWAIGMLITLLGVCIGGGVSYLSYWDSISVEVLPETTPVESVTYSGVIVEEAAMRFRERAKAFAAIRDVGGNAAPVSAPAPVETTATTTESVTEPDVPPVVEVPVTDTGATEEDGTPVMSF